MRRDCCQRECWTLFADGAARGNPGPAGIGYVLCSPEGQVVRRGAESIGKTTNNVAEYKALLRGLEEALDQGVKHLHIHSDSELLIRQLTGQYRVRQPHLKTIHGEVLSLLKQLGWHRLEHVPREANREADRLANLGVAKGLPAGQGGLTADQERKRHL